MLSLVLSVVLGLLMVETPVVHAHGEHNLEPFVRMSGVAFMDVHFSQDRLAINETMTITGKFRIMESWPRMLGVPEWTWMGILIPGPKLAVRER